MKLIYSLAFSLFILTSVHADPENYKNRTVKGTVIDKDNKLPLEYATISFYSITKQKIVNGTITDINGNFEIKVSEDIYNIKIPPFFYYFYFCL